MFLTNHSTPPMPSPPMIMLGWVRVILKQWTSNTDENILQSPHLDFLESFLQIFPNLTNRKQSRPWLSSCDKVSSIEMEPNLFQYTGCHLTERASPWCGGGARDSIIWLLWQRWMQFAVLSRNHSRDLCGIYISSVCNVIKTYIQNTFTRIELCLDQISILINKW